MTTSRASRSRLAAATLITLVITFIVPLPVYALLSALDMASMPAGGSPAAFMLGVLVQKIGVALGFVWLMHAAFDTFGRRWLRYALIWWMMYAIVEIGQAIGPNSSAGDALGDIISEAVYFPLSGWAAARLLGGARRDVEGEAVRGGVSEGRV